MGESWLPDLERMQGSKYETIAGAIRSAIDAGTLRPGERLPPQRALAETLKVDLTTVTRAYDAIRRLGLIEARGRAGSFIASAIEPPPSETAPVDAGMNMPPELPGGKLATLIADTTRTLLASFGPTRLQYQPAGGSTQARAAGASLLAQWGMPCAAEQVLITAGGQHALFSALETTLQSGDAIACGRFVYPGFKALAVRMKLRLVPLRKMTGTALDEACLLHKIKALYIVPTNDNPTAATISAEDRVSLADAARRHGIQIIEDDAYGALAAEPLPALAQLAPERCWYIASTSKILSPALRVAFLRAPHVGAALSAAARLHETAVMAPPLNVALVSTWLSDGTFSSLVKQMRAESALRQELANELLVEYDRQWHPQGYHFWLKLPKGVNPDTLIDLMRPTGLSMVAANRFAIEHTDEKIVRVSLGGLLDQERLRTALRLLQGYLMSSGSGAMPLI